MKLVEFKEIKGIITIKSGLHIGGGDSEMKIGGTDNPVIKHPHTFEPYIPGSSLKGKVRSLLEMRSGLMVHTDGSPVSLKTLKKASNEQQKIECSKILKLFGVSGSDSDEDEIKKIGPCRISFADCHLNDLWKKSALDANWAFTEMKTENSINRIAGTAENPRITERVPSGAKFDFYVTLKKLDTESDDFKNEEKDLENLLLKGLKLLEMDALGGSGSRGYGKIKFEFSDAEIKKKFENIELFNK
ncbi:MAG: type III-A CRISPR-associated RAMP protein Csm3 [Desulfobacterales bacterium]|nr:type III-A CRISPR-associated RAMP protein Csm3 [Desulfobacterales bacterium]